MPGKRWTEEEIATLRIRWELGMSSRRIADHLPGRSAAAIRMYATETLRLQKRWTPGVRLKRVTFYVGDGMRKAIDRKLHERGQPLGDYMRQLVARDLVLPRSRK
jgi:hypothetical protein